MAYQAVFKRYELKYLLTCEQKARVLQAMEPHMELDQYTTSYELARVKTTNMGSMFRLTYNVALKDVSKEKELIDALRCRNGNLEISVSRQETTTAEL